MKRFEGFQELLSYYAERCPLAPALIYTEADEQQVCTYAELSEAARQSAEHWKQTEKTCLGVFCDGSFQNVVSIFGAVFAGMQVVLLDENASKELLEEQIFYTDIDLLCGEEELTEEFTPFLTGGLTEKHPGNILFFTSGTTDSSKAVVLTDQSLMNSAYNGGAKLPLSPDDRLLCMLPLNHVFGFVCSLLWGLSSGAAVALGRGARHYLDDLKFYRPTAVAVVPLLLGFLIRQDALNPELHLVLVGAGDCPNELLSAVTARGIHVSFGYGLTETSSGVAISVSGDPYAMEICPDDTITLASDGEILIQAPTCMMQGYYKRPDDTNAILRDGVLYTGDLGMLDEDGRLHIIGRKKEMLVLQDGTKIFLPEYEAQIQRVLGDREFAVIEKQFAPALVIRGDSGEKEELQRKLRHAMSMRPRGQQLREIIFVKEPLPRTATGKVKRWELQQKVVEK